MAFCGISGRDAKGGLLLELFAFQFLPTGEQPIELTLGFSMRLVRGV